MNDMCASAAEHAEPSNGRRRDLILRIPLLLCAAIALVAGLFGGLLRLGLPLNAPGLVELHGPLLISGLFGTLIAVERAVAIGARWAFAAPCFAGLGTILLLAGAPTSIGAAAYATSALILSAAGLAITFRQPAVFTGTLMFSSLAWLAGNVLWGLGHSVSEVSGWWLAFLVLTIAAERLSLSRLLIPKRGSLAVFLFALGLFLVGAQNGIKTNSGAILFGSALLLTTGWLLRHDIARYAIRQQRQVRYMAVCMLAAYSWLAVAGLSLITSSAQLGFSYELAMHATLIGFVISMMFGHALVILPAILGMHATYRSWLYCPLILLNVSVALRFCAGLAEWELGRHASGLLTVAAIACFAAMIAASTRGSAASSRMLPLHES